MAKVISFVNLKGGVAKSTTTVTLAEVLATAFIKKVLVIDLDPQSAATAMLCGEDRIKRRTKEKLTSLELMRSRKGDKADRFVDKEVSDITLPNGCQLDVIPSHPDMMRYNEGDLRARGTPELLEGDATFHNKLGTLLERYDYVLIDCPPSVGRLTRFGLIFSDFYVVPTIPDFLSSRMFYKTVEAVEDFKAYYEERGHATIRPCRFVGVIITKYQEQITTHKNIISDIRSKPFPSASDRVNVFLPYIRQSVNLVRPFEDYPIKDDGSLGGKRPTDSDDNKLKKEHKSYIAKYKSGDGGAAGDLYSLAGAIQAL